MESTNKQTRALIDRHKTDSNMNINPLSMKLGGIIDAAVMGGVTNYEKVWKHSLVDYEYNRFFHSEIDMRTSATSAVAWKRDMRMLS